MSGLRAGLATAYARAWRRAAPRAAHALPQLPAEPLSRRFGQERGRPIDRVYVERFLDAHAADVRGRYGLEIHEPTYLRRLGAERIDVLDADPDAQHATIRGDFRALPAKAFDVFVCTQTLSAVGDPVIALREARAALKPGGVLLLTVPGISHDVPGAAFPEHVRYTSHGLRNVAGQVFEQLEVVAYGNVRTAAAFLYGMAAEELAPEDFAVDDPAYELVVALRAVR